MSHLAEITKSARELTDAEWTALGPALANNRPANFDQEDVVRMVIYRRAIHAGMYTDPHLDTAGPWSFDMDYLRTGILR